MRTFDTPSELSDIQKERWERGGQTISHLLASEVLNEAMMHACDSTGQWWELVVHGGQGSASIGGPRQVEFDEAPADCWRLEVVLEAPVEFGTFIQLALRFPDATIYMPEIALHKGECRPIQKQADLDLVTIFEI